MEFTLEFHVRSISPLPFRRFALYFTQMFLSVRQCTEPMIRQRRLKVKLQAH